MPQTKATTDSTRPHRAKRGEGDRLRTEILDATEQLLIDTGDTDKISIRSVADAVGRTPPSIYLHFANKDELIHAVCERQFDLMAVEFDRTLEGIDDPVTRIAVMGETYVAFALAHPEQYRVIFMGGVSDDEEEDLDALKTTACFAQLHDAVEAAIASGAFAPGDPKMVSLALWAAVHGVAALLIAHDHDWPPVDMILQQVFRQNLDGLRPR